MPRIIAPLSAAALFACMGLAGLGACSHLPSSGLTAKQEEAVRQGVMEFMELLKNPEPARFGAMSVRKAEYEGTFDVCGHVGDAPYYGVLASGPKGDVFVVIGLGFNETGRATTVKLCEEKGMPIR